MRGPGRTAAVAVVTALFLATTAGMCTVEQAHACATVDTPPIAVDPALCTAPPGDGTLSNGVRWYSVPAGDVAEDDERPIPGQALDGDWWDWTEQADMGDAGHSKTKATKAPRSTPKKKATKR